MQEATHTTGWASVSAGYDHTCAVKISGSLWCWGGNHFGELGDGTTTGSAVPVRVATRWRDWVAVTASDVHTCAITTSRTLWCWGINDTGELGNGTYSSSTVPVRVATRSGDWASVTAGYLHGCAVKAPGTLWCWGDSENGQLGNGTTTGSAVPVQVATHARDWAAVTAGGYHTCAVKTAAPCGAGGPTITASWETAP